MGDAETLPPLKLSDLALICNRDHKTVYNWVRSGFLEVQRTPGRHIRIERAEVVRFLLAYGYKVPADLKPAKAKRGRVSK